MGYVLRYPDLPRSEPCKPILLPGGDRGLGCPPGCSWCHPQGHVANLRLSISASTAPRPQMHPPRRCSGVVAGRLPPPFRPALSTVSFPSWGRVSLRLGDASYFCSTSLLCTLLPAGASWLKARSACIGRVAACGPSDAHHACSWVQDPLRKINGCPGDP